MAKETPFDRARDFVEEKIDRTKETLGDSYSKARDQFDDVSEDVRKSVKSTAKRIEKDYGYLWDDLRDYGWGEYFQYRTFGTPGGRVFNLFFRNRLFSSVCGSNAIQVMIQIHESSNIVNVTYTDFSGCEHMRGGGATLGLQAANFAKAVMAGYDSPVLDDNRSHQSMSFQPPP